MTPGILTLEEAADKRWDVIVVGTGMGGATFGYELARRGKSVLFCERGSWNLDPKTALVDKYPEEEYFDKVSTRSHLSDAELLRRAGRDIDPIVDVTDPKRPRQFVPFIGSGTGGSSAIYGMAMERFFPEDCEPLKQHPGAVGSSLPAKWPISYDELVPWYERAEALYRIRGSIDPLRSDFDREHPLKPSPAKLTPAAEWLKSQLERSKLHPYRLPIACEFVKNCSGCQGYLCRHDCKNDSARICLAPAIAEHDARIVVDCRVTRLKAEGTQVTGVVCRWHDGTPRTLQADTVALAAGALQSPALLLRSGLGNDSGQVGRNLMRHAMDLYLIKTPNSVAGGDNRQKQLAFNDFYAEDYNKYKYGKLGSVQSFGRLPPRQMLFHSLLDDVYHSRWRALVPLLRLSEPLLRRDLDSLVKCNLVLAATVEDLPYTGNRVELGEGDDPRLRMRYKLEPYQKERIATFRRVLSKHFQNLSYKLLKQAENNLRIAHVCGTCRFGEDRNNSVLDRNNKVHDMDNLYVVDASFFPSSGGTNPSLTIAANAMRVADVLIHLEKEPVSATSSQHVTGALLNADGVGERCNIVGNDLQYD